MLCSWPSWACLPNFSVKWQEKMRLEFEEVKVTWGEQSFCRVSLSCINVFFFFVFWEHRRAQWAIAFSSHADQAPRSPLLDRYCYHSFLFTFPLLQGERLQEGAQPSPAVILQHHKIRMGLCLSRWSLLPFHYRQTHHRLGCAHHLCGESSHHSPS